MLGFGEERIVGVVQTVWNVTKEARRIWVRERERR